MKLNFSASLVSRRVCVPSQVPATYQDQRERCITDPPRGVARLLPPAACFSLLRSLLPFLQGLVKIIAHLVGSAATFYHFQLSLCASQALTCQNTHWCRNSPSMHKPCTKADSSSFEVSPESSGPAQSGAPLLSYGISERSNAIQRCALPPPDLAPMQRRASRSTELVVKAQRYWPQKALPSARSVYYHTRHMLYYTPPDALCAARIFGT
jgi:hypothetical protein